MSLRLWGLIGTGAVILSLLCAVLWLRGNNAKLSGQIDVIELQRDTAIQANKENQRTIEAFRAQRIDNDAIATLIASKLNANRARTERSRQQLREAQNDPNVRNWANQPVPDSVSRAINPAR